MTADNETFEHAERRSLATYLGFGAGGIFLILGLVSYVGYLGAKGLAWPHFVAAGAVLIAGAEGLHRQQLQRRQDSIEERLPDFLRHLATSRASGLTLKTSMDAARDGDYGALKPEIERMSVQLGFNAPPAEVFANFGHRARSKMVDRVVALMQDALTSGGRTTAALKAAAREAETLRELRENRESQLWVYVSIVYVAFSVFTLVMIVLSTYFLAPVFGAEGNFRGGDISRVFGTNGLDEQFAALFIWGITVSGLGSGMAIGAIVRGKPLAGLHHGAALVLAGYLLFALASL